MDSSTEPDRLILLCDLRDELKVSGESIRRWRRDAKFPLPDVNLSRRTVGWKRSTLAKAGINLPVEREKLKGAA